MQFLSFVHHATYRYHRVQTRRNAFDQPTKGDKWCFPDAKSTRVKSHLISHVDKDCNSNAAEPTRPRPPHEVLQYCSKQEIRRSSDLNPPYFVRRLTGVSNTRNRKWSVYAYITRRSSTSLSYSIFPEKNERRFAFADRPSSCMQQPWRPRVSGIHYSTQLSVLESENLDCYILWESQRI